MDDGGKEGEGGGARVDDDEDNDNNNGGEGIHLGVCVCCYDNALTDGTLSAPRSLSAEYEDGRGLAAAVERGRPTMRTRPVDRRCGRGCWWGRLHFPPSSWVAINLIFLRRG